MGVNEKNNHSEVTEKATENLSMSEMEEVSGGSDIYDKAREAVIRVYCQMGKHVYDTREEKRVDQGGAYFSRKISVCKRCGHTEMTGWSPFGK